MKTLLLLLAFPSMALAQGQVQFANTTSTRLYDYRSGTAVPLPAGTFSRVQLYFAPDSPTVPDPSAFVPIGPSVGFLGGGLFNNGPRTIPDIYAGEAAWFSIRLWETFGNVNSYEDRVASGTGAVAQFTTRIVLQGTPLVGPSTPPAPLTSGSPPFQSFGYHIIPEPATTWLLLASALALGITKIKGKKL